MAYDSLIRGTHGLMAAVVEGKYAMVQIPDPKLGPRKVDIKEMFNTDRYRPTYTNKEGLPLLLTRA
jgi:6-phosphofructokinase 1